MLAQIVRDPAKTDRREKVDGKPRVFGAVFREERRESAGHVRIGEALDHQVDAHEFRHFLHEFLDENPARRCCVVFVQFHNLKHIPRDGVRDEQVRKKFGALPEFVGFQAMDGGVLLVEFLAERVLIRPLQLAETCGQEAKKLEV